MTNWRLRNRLFPGKRDEVKMIDTAKDFSGRKADNVLMDAFTAWESLSEFRRKAERNKMYVFGDQWGDRIVYNGKSMTERESISKQGNVPITNNRLRGIVSSVSGLFLQNQTEPLVTARERDGQAKSEVLTATMQYVYQLNKMWDLDVSNFTNFIISGLAACKSEYGDNNGKVDVWTSNIDYSRVFFDNHMEDVRMWDCHMVGELEDMSVYDVMARYSNGDKKKAEWIRRVYSHVDSERLVSYANSYVQDSYAYKNFATPDDNTRCRVITVWRKEAKERLLVHDTLGGEYYKVEVSDEENIALENERRQVEQSANGVLPEDMKLLKYKWTVDNYWYFYNLSPMGDVLMEGETPYWHGSHPYAFKFYKFYDKQVYPFVSGFIDQQRYINRLIMMQDFMMRASAKGVLMIPQSAINGTGRTPEEFAEDWIKFNGVIVYTPKAGEPPPQQIVSNSTNLGVYDMLSVQLKMLEDVSGVQGALQGRAPNSGTPAALYAQQSQNSSTTLSEMFSFYNMYREEKDYKNLKLIQQFYDSPRYINVSGRDLVMYDPKEVRDTESELTITESTSTPSYRMVVNDMLMNLLNGGHIMVEEMLENGAFPFADKLLQSIKGRREQMQQQAQGGQIDPNALSPIPSDIQQGVAQQSNPQAVAMLNNILAGNAA